MFAGGRPRHPRMWLGGQWRCFSLSEVLSQRRLTCWRALDDSRSIRSIMPLDMPVEPFIMLITLLA